MRAIFLGDLVGIDANGIRYYKARYPHPITRRKQRWAVFPGGTDASCVPPEWHMWLHYSMKKLPAKPFAENPAQKPHTFNNNSGTQATHWPAFIRKICFNIWKPSKNEREP